MNNIINNFIKVHPQIWRFILSCPVTEKSRLLIKQKQSLLGI
jgi:hypothetical protein